MGMLLSRSTLRKHQALFFKALLGVLVVGGGLLLWIGRETPQAPSTHLSADAPIYDVTRALEDKSFWLFKAENKLLEQEEAQGKIRQELAELKASLSPKAAAQEEEMLALHQRIEQLEQAQLDSQASLQQEARTSEENDDRSLQHFEASKGVGPTALNDQNAALLPTAPAIFSDTLNLSSTAQSKLSHKDSFIPPGTYTKAVLLSGVDVSAGISSQANPKPVLLRLVHRGSLPNKAYGKMKDCRIIAAAYGDLSSERAYMRLEKLSCVQPDGHVIVTDVDGYVNGEDGKNGIRGKVVLRDAEVLKRGFLGGLLSGLGKATSQSYNSSQLSPFGPMTTGAKGGDIFKQAGSQGIGDAFELMAKYNIQRAEQYQPVIQISAGLSVDVVFHSGSHFGEQKSRKNPKQSNANLLEIHGNEGEQHD
ncbi:MAG: hypothetical protein KA508_00395 [Gammaproteobacteria bacterium]|nr:hypothetical protein [Gammaproteobacteria bacterium]